MQRTSAALCALLTGAGFAAAAATSSQAAESNRFSCSAQPLSIRIAGQAAVNPSGAGSDTGSCGSSTGGGGGSLPLGTLEGVYATTAVSPSAGVAPALQQPLARSGVLNLQTVGGVGLRIQGVTSETSASCSGGAARFASSGGVTGVSVAGQSIPLVDGAITQVGGILGALPVRLELNRVTQDASGYAFRAVRVVAPADGSVIDVSAGMTRIGVAGSPCTDGPTPGPNPGPTPGPAPDGSGSGGGSAATANPLFPAGYAYLRNSPCIKSRAFGVKPGILGNAKKNRLKGTKKANRIMGYGANDRLTGGGGRDCLEGGTGNDVESGGAKGDILYGRQGKDRLDGGSGNDRLAGASGNDSLKGGSGNDRISGDSGKDRIAGGSGKDRLSGGAGNDRITGGSGRDRINCGKGRDVAIIGKGDKAARNCERVIRKKGKRY